MPHVVHECHRMPHVISSTRPVTSHSMCKVFNFPVFDTEHLDAAFSTRQMSYSTFVVSIFRIC